MNPEYTPHAFDAAGVPVYLLLPIFLLLLGGWMRTHVWSRRLSGRWNRAAAFAGRTLVGFLTLLAASGLAEKVVVFSTSWNVWSLMLAGALLVESIMALARLERNIISRRAGRTLTLLRLGAVLAVLVVLCQPVRIFDAIRRFQRHVVVLLDVSGSMQVPDNNLTDSEKVRLAEALRVPAARRAFAVDRVAAGLKAAGEELQAQSDGLNALAAAAPDLRARHIERNAAGWSRKFTQARQALANADKALAAAAAAPFLTGPAAIHADSLRKFSTRLGAEGTQPLDRLIAWTARGRVAATNGPAFEEARETLRKTAAFLAGADTLLDPAGDGVDEAFYRSLTPANRAAVDRVAAMSRSEAAVRLLLNRPASAGPGGRESAPGILERLDREYGVRFLTFGAFPAEVRTRTLLDAPDTAVIRPDISQKQGSDLAAAIEKAGSDLPPEQIAGVVLMSDGRHNAPGSVETVARRLGVQRIPVFPVVMGGTRYPPTDAAIASVAAPESVCTNDKVSFTLDLKLDGLAGTNVAVTLFDGETVVATNTVTPAAPAFRGQLLLSDVPRTNGLHAYRVRVQSFTGEVDTVNNEQEMPVAVSSDPVKVLLIDGYPRWEFRYLKNLFLQRDQNVRLQYLLFHPDRIAGITNQVQRPASVMAAAGEAEATALPANEAEWMKFDVIILGDVAPDELGSKNQRILRDYVVNRGGTLIILAGMRHMPQAYAGTPLAEALPVTFTPSVRPLLAAPEAEFRLALTAGGRNSLFLKLDDDAARNLAIWDGIPTVYWRNGSLRAKEGATVLAYAEGPRRAGAGLPPRIPDAETLARQRQTEKEKPLLVSHQAGFGSVLMFGFDHTWRLRYRKGDAYHHKLWGQILRWGTADRIASGSSTLRVGTSRTRYPSGVPVRVVARIATADFMPVTNASPSVVIRSETGSTTLRRPLRYRAGSPGLYAAEISALPAGRYRVELESAGTALVSREKEAEAVGQFSITAAADSETVELSADSGLMNGIAALTGGKALKPADLDSLADRLGAANVTAAERRQVDLWNSWPWLLLIVALLTAEWMVRKKVRLP